MCPVGRGNPVVASVRWRRARRVRAFRSERTALNPSAATSPRATLSHKPSSTSVGPSPVMTWSSEWKRAPRPRRASRISRPDPRPGSAGATAPRWAWRSQGRSSRSMKVIGVRRDGRLPGSRPSGDGEASPSAAGSRTDSRPQTTSPDRHRSSSHSGRYDSTRSAKIRSQSPAGHSKPCSCSITSASPARPLRRVPGAACHQDWRKTCHSSWLIGRTCARRRSRE